MHLGPLTDLYGTPGAPKRAHFGPKWPFWGPRGAQVHDMDALHPGTLCGSVLDARRPVSAIPGAPRGPKGAPKMRIVTFWPFRPPKRPRGRSSSKHKSYLRYRNGLWRFNRDFNFFRFGSRKLATWADMGPPTGNRGAPGATSGPLFP